MNYYILINPNSGKKKSLDTFNKILKPILDKKNHTYTHQLTTHQNHAKEIIQKIDLSDTDAILVLGGDGTMHEVVNGMLNREDNYKIPVGNIPTGSGNSLLYDIGKYDIKKTIDLILKNNIRKIDVLKVSSKTQIIYSINLVGWGMGNDIGVLAEKLRWLGPMRYNVASIIEIFRFKGRKAILSIDNNKYEDYYTLITVCNTIHVGKGMKMAPKATLDDGKMDIVMIKNNFTKFELLKLFPKLFSGEHIKNNKVIYKQAESFTLKPLNDEILNIDGEIIGRTPIDIKIINKGIELLN